MSVYVCMYVCICMYVCMYVCITTNSPNIPLLDLPLYTFLSILPSISSFKILSLLSTHPIHLSFLFAGEAAVAEWIRRLAQTRVARVRIRALPILDGC